VCIGPLTAGQYPLAVHKDPQTRPSFLPFLPVMGTATNPPRHWPFMVVASQSQSSVFPFIFVGNRVPVAPESDAPSLPQQDPWFVVAGTSLPLAGVVYRRQRCAGASQPASFPEPVSVTFRFLPPPALHCSNQGHSPSNRRCWRLPTASPPLPSGAITRHSSTT
jgi:hypothetical protein